MSDKIYLAEYSEGAYDDYHIIIVFASENKEHIEKWVDKFNSKIEYWQNYYATKYGGREGFPKIIKEEYQYNEILWEKFNKIMYIGKAYIEEVNKR